MNEQEAMAMIEKLRDAGYLVAFIPPEDVGEETDAGNVEDMMRQRGYNAL